MTINKKKIFEYFRNCSQRNFGRNETNEYLLVLISFDKNFVSLMRWLMNIVRCSSWRRWRPFRLNQRKKRDAINVSFWKQSEKKKEILHRLCLRFISARLDESFSQLEQIWNKTNSIRQTTTKSTWFSPKMSTIVASDGWHGVLQVHVCIFSQTLINIDWTDKCDEYLKISVEQLRSSQVIF